MGSKRLPSSSISNHKTRCLLSQDLAHEVEENAGTGLHSNPRPVVSEYVTLCSFCLIPINSLQNAVHTVLTPLFFLKEAAQTGFHPPFESHLDVLPLLQKQNLDWGRTVGRNGLGAVWLH